MEFDHNWHITKLDPNDLTQPLQLIHICAYLNEGNVGDDDGGTPTNHWVMLLEVEGKRAVVLDVLPGSGPDGQTGIVSLESSGSALTEPWIKTHSISPRSGTTVENIIRLIQIKGRQRYTFVRFEGCRYWHSIFAGDLEAEGIVPPEWVVGVRESLGYYWQDPEGENEWAIEVGASY